MAVDRKIERLAQLTTFAGVSRRALKRLARLADEVDVREGAHLSEQGGYASEAFIVMEGLVAVERDGVELDTIGPGAVVGEVALLEHSPRNATLVARTPVHLLVFGVREFGALLDEFPGLAQRIRADAAQRHRAKGARA